MAISPAYRYEPNQICRSTMTTKLSGLFDAYYFSHGCLTPYGEGPGWDAMFKQMADRITRDIQPMTVLDAGCALGLLVEALRKNDVEAYGVDLSDYAIQNAPAAVAPYCRVGSITEPFDRMYDLIVCIEVLEHMPAAEVEAAVHNLCQHTNDILFSSTPFDYKEATHFHVQPPEYWAELFSHQGFFRDVDFDASFITPWAVRWRRRTEPLHRLIRDYERRFWLLWKENTDLRQEILAARHQLSQQEQALLTRPDNAALIQERDELRNLIQRYERGKFIRLMRWLKQRLAIRTRL